MTIAELKQFLITGVALHYGILLIWFLLFKCAHGLLYQLHASVFRLTPRRFDFTHYVSMALYKVFIVLFYFVPWATLSLMY